jgi:hypothetical protein
MVCDGPELLSAFEREFIFEPRSRRRLRPWLQRYEPQKVSRLERREDALDNLQRALAAVRLRLEWNERSGSLVLTARGTLSYDSNLFRIRLVPLGLKNTGRHLIDIQPALKGKALEFRNADLANLGEFVLVRIEPRDSKGTAREFLMAATVKGPAHWRDRRDQRVLRDVLGDRELLELVVGLLKNRRISATSESATGGEQRHSNRRSNRVEAVLEAVLKTWATERERFADFSAALGGLVDGATGEAGARLHELVQLLGSVDSASHIKDRR